MRMLTTLILAAAGPALIAGSVFAAADVQIIHNSPDPGAASVDIYLDEGADPAVSDLGFREATPVLSLPSEVELRIGIAPGNSAGPQDIIATFPVNLDTGGRYVVMAAGVLDGSLPRDPGNETAFDLYIYDRLTTGAPAGEVGLLAFHGAPDAPPVNVDAMGVGNLVPDLEFGTFAGYLFVPAADYVLKIAAVSDPQNYVAAFTAPLSGLGGGAAVVFASGFLTAKLDAFGLFAALPDGTVLELSTAPVPNETFTLGGLKSLYDN